MPSADLDHPDIDPTAASSGVGAGTASASAKRTSSKCCHVVIVFIVWSTDRSNRDLLALRVTPGSIKAFIRYFATDIIGVVYSIPRDFIQANIALTELLFFR